MCLLTWLGGSKARGWAGDQPNSPERIKVSGVRFDPVVRKIEGWTVHVEPALIDGEHREEGTRALRMLADQLNRIAILLPPERLEEIRTVEIWIEH